MSSNDPRPELIITQASLRHQQSSTLIKVALPRRTREQPGSARQIGTLLQLHSSTHATTRICKVNWHTSGQTFSVSTLWMSISRLQSHKKQPAYNMDEFHGGKVRPSAVQPYQASAEISMQPLALFSSTSLRGPFGAPTRHDQRRRLSGVSWRS